MKRFLIAILGVIFLLGSCELFENEDGTGLSNTDIVEGLKTALMVGTDSSATALSVVNGYYGDALVKIPLPDEALKVQGEINTILSLAPSLSSYLNLDQQFENVVKSINKAAEQAAKDAGPIFKGAITKLDITMGLQILNGEVPNGDIGMKSSGFDSTAATQYLKQETFVQLTGTFSEMIDPELNKDLGLGFSANQAWNTLRTSYNNAVNTIQGNFVTRTALQLTGKTLEPLETETIGVFATEKALDGLYFKVGETEKKIRRDPWEWISTTVGNILTKIFG